MLPYAKDAWYKPESVRIGYEISFNRYFYKPAPLRSLDEIRADILALQSDADSLLPDFILREPRSGIRRETADLRGHVGVRGV